MGFKLISSLLLTLMILCSTLEVCAEVLYKASSVGTLKAKKSEARSLNQQGSVAGKVWLEENIINDFLWIPKENKLRYVTTEAHPESFPLLNNKNEVAGFIYIEEGKIIGTNKNAFLITYFYDPVSGNKEKGDKTYVGIITRTRWQKWINSMLPKSFSKLTVYYLKGFNDKGERLFIDDLEPSKVKASVVYLQNNPYVILKDNISSINNHSEMLITLDENLLRVSLMPRKHQLIIKDSKDKLVEIVANEALYGIALSDNLHVIAVNKDGTEGFFWFQNDYSSEKLISLGSFIPIALNNHGDVIGKLYLDPHSKSDEDPSFWLRKIDGTMIDLNGTIDFGEINVEKVTHMWAINDAGQILISAKIDGSTHALLLNPLDLLGK